MAKLMNQFRGEQLDSDIASELFEDINEHYRISEQALIELDRNPADVELVHTLFRSVHSMKGNLGIVGFSPAMPLVTAIEDLLGFMRHGSLEYSPTLSDLLLLVLDQVRSYVEAFRVGGSLEYDPQQVEQLGQAISALGDLPDDQRDAGAAAIIRQIDPSVVIVESELEDTQQPGSQVLREYDLQDDEDLRFFRAMITPVEKRSHYWIGRGDRILKMAFILNKLGGQPVDEKQLALAVYVHDFGMAFMPLELLHKQSVLSNDEIQLLRSHVEVSAHLLEHMPRWSVAREIVMQHHEAANGTGYPIGLRENEICEGAKILAVADTFDAMTHQRAYATHQSRPIIRAVKEINDLSGRQLSPRWVEIFNQAVQPVLIAHRIKHF